MAVSTANFETERQRIAQQWPRDRRSICDPSQIAQYEGQSAVLTLPGFNLPEAYNLERFKHQCHKQER